MLAETKSERRRNLLDIIAPAAVLRLAIDLAVDRCGRELLGGNHGQIT